MVEWSIAVTVEFWEDPGRMILSRELAEVADNDDDEPGLETPPLEFEEGLADRAPSLETPTMPSTPAYSKSDLKEPVEWFWHRWWGGEAPLGSLRSQPRN
ncbi:hypothetical protein PG988_014566 [Apiospora saccharicola]